jgi:hypothetical protein
MINTMFPPCLRHFRLHPLRLPRPYQPNGHLGHMLCPSSEGVSTALPRHLPSSRLKLVQPGKRPVKQLIEGVFGNRAAACHE